MDRRVDGCMEGWMGERMDIQVGRWKMGKWMGGWMGERDR